ncbi:MAG: hypothetical protein SFY92_00710 [Verrucomicrobiae bacterium]|nr:hypothetical protein [Verrucomicrobiae bacterium]
MIHTPKQNTLHRQESRLRRLSWYTLTLCLFSPVALWGQMAVNDAGAQTQRAVQHTDILGQWAKDVENFNKEFAKIQEHVEIAQKALTIAGDPSQALSMLGSMGNLGTNSAFSSTFKLANALGETMDTAKSLQGTGQGLYASIPNTLPDGSSFTRNMDLYKKFAAYEDEKGNHEKVLEEVRDKRKTIMSELEKLNNVQTKTEAEQRAVSVRIGALTAQLAALNAEETAANNQRQARKEANDNDAEKQRKAEEEARIEVEKRADKKAKAQRAESFKKNGY